MNMVVVKHPNDNGKYIFCVPDDVELDADTLVEVETTRGIQPGICLTGTFRADPEVVCKLWNTTPENMKRVVSHLVRHYIEWPKKKDEEP